MTVKPLVLTETRGPVFIVTINRIEARNAVDGATAAELLSAFSAFDTDDSRNVVLKFFEAIGHADPLTMDARRRLSAILFS